LRGVDAETRSCIESWFTQNYAAPTQLLFGVAAADDPVCPLVEDLIKSHPGRDARLILCAESLGRNSKVSTLAQLEQHARHDVLVVSDADVLVPPDFLVNVVAPLRDSGVGLVSCFYCFSNPVTLAMRWEAIGTNADFWSQVLQAKSLAPLDFALGAAMATRRELVKAINGFRPLADDLADDYQLGRRIAGLGSRIELSPVVVECREAPASWKEAWQHQLRWARTIRFCRPPGWFFSILGNGTLWPLLWLLTLMASRHTDAANFAGASDMNQFARISIGICVAFLIARVLFAISLHARLAQSAKDHWWFWLVPFKDLLGALVWLVSFLGNRIEWRGRCYQILAGGKLAPLSRH
jgi:ceramide glucosyltransferase